KVQFVPPPSPLVLAYDMKTLTPDGRMQDRTGNGNHGTLRGTTDIAGQIDRARHFDGGSEKITAAPALAGLTAWSFALWIYWDGSTAAQYRHPLNVGDMTLYLDTTLTPGAYFAFTASGSDGLIMPHIQAGQWNHIVLVGDLASVKAYFNGALVDYPQGNPFTLTSNLVELGTRRTNWFDGRIDEVRVYNRALDASEIAAIAPIPPPPPGPGLYFDMENITADGQMKDLSGNRSHGTLTGTTDIVGKTGRARHFDGASEKIAATPALAGLTSWSFALWLYWDGSTAIQYRHPVNVGGITLYLDTNLGPGAYLAFTAHGGVDGLIMSHMPAGQWRHVALEGDSAGVRAYLRSEER